MLQMKLARPSSIAVYFLFISSFVILLYMYNLKFKPTDAESTTLDCQENTENDFEVNIQKNIGDQIDDNIENLKDSLEPLTMLLGVVGDILLHKVHQEMGFKVRSFLPLWAPIQHLLDMPDLLYGNFEGTSTSQVLRPRQNFSKEWNPPLTGCEVVTSDLRMEYGRVYHSWDNAVGNDTPHDHDNKNWFNYHPQLVWDLRHSGLNIVSTANNHAWDTCEEGLEKTIDILEEADIKNFGTKRKGGNEKWWKMTKTTVTSDSIQVTYTLAWVACTGIINSDKKKRKQEQYKEQLMLCDSKEFRDIIQYLDTERRDIDGVIAAVHEGVNYSEEPRGIVREYVKTAVAAGAFLVLANHPHRPQKIEQVHWKQGDETRESLVVWSVGDFLNYRFVSGILMFQLQKKMVGVRKRVRVQCFQFMPLCNINLNKQDERKNKLHYNREWEMKHSPVLHATEEVLANCDVEKKGEDEGCEECRRAEEKLEQVWGKEFKMNLEQGFQCKLLPSP